MKEIKPEDYDTAEEFEEALDKIRALIYEKSPIAAALLHPEE